MRFQPNRWMKQTQHVYGVERDDGKVLAMVIVESDGLFGVMALESSKDALDGAGVQGILDNHAHQIVGRHRSRSLRGAKERAERYVRKWRKSTVVAPRCGCREIDAEFEG